MAKVDVLLPFWGDVELLKQAVESVLAQTEQDWRLIVADDCYPSDEPASYFEKLADKRITYIRHKVNLGITKNFNFLTYKASAPHCILLGCDDKLLPHYIERALQMIGDADMYQPKVEVINERGITYLPIGDRVKRLLQPKKAGIYKGEKLAASLCHGNWLYFPSILWKTSTIQKYGFNQNYGVTQDVYLELSIIIDKGSLYFDNNLSFQYRRFANSVSSVEKSSGKRFNEEARVYDHFNKIFVSIGWKKSARASRLRLTSRANKLIS
jgi:glycosyltransferase involved in cell wall biosynthesis